MGKFDSQLERMRSLMTYGLVSESDNHENSHSMEYTAVAADGKTYGIIKECNKYYIKVATPGKEKLVEGYDYLGGFMNKNEHEYSSYSNALKQFELKLRSINEAYDVKVNIDTLDPYRKEDLVIEGTQKMKDEIARQRQIMNNVCALMNESATIGMNNTGNPEAPKTSGLDSSKSAPFTDKAEAKLDKDLKATASDPEKQGEPFEDKAEANMDADMKTTSNSPEKMGEPFGEKAQYVPDNSVADKKPSGGKVVKVNESVENDEEEFDGDLLLDNEDEMPEIEGDDEYEVEGDETEMGDEELPVDDAMSEEEPEMDDDEDVDFNFEEFDDEDILGDEEGSDNDVMARIAELEAELEELKSMLCDGDEECEAMADGETEMGDEELPVDDAMSEEEPSKEMPKEEDEIEEARTAGAVAGVGAIDNVRNEMNTTSNGFKKYTRMVAIRDQFNSGEVSPEEAESLYQESDRLAEEIIDMYGSNPKIVKAIEALNASIFDAFDSLVGKDMDNEFDAENSEYINSKVHEPEVNDESEFDYDEDAAEQEFVKSLSTESFNNFLGKIIKEEMTKLNVFGKHPGYRKKPMNLPQTGSDEFQGNKDWNDESVRSEQPFGSQIGDSAPFDKMVESITEAVMKDIKKKI